MLFPRSPVRRACGLLMAIIAAPAVLAAEGEMVAVDQSELAAYWRADRTGTETLELSSEGPELYGCMAVPFVIDPQGRVSPGRHPLLARVGHSGGERLSEVDSLYIYVMGALPGFSATWDKPLSDTIYSSYSLVFGDSRIRSRLGDTRWAALRENLERQCRITDLAGWVGKNDAAVIQSLPGRPEDLLAAPR